MADDFNISSIRSSSSTRKRRRSLSSSGQARRSEVLAAALKCFNNLGVDATSIEMICQASGASVGSIYHFFGGKEDIATALYLEGRMAGEVLALERLATARSAEDGVRALVTAFVDWVTANPDLARYVYATSDGSIAHRAAETPIRSYYRKLDAWFASHTKSFCPLPPIVRIAIIYGPLHKYAKLWLLGWTVKSPKAVSNDFFEAVWRALRA